MATTEQCPCIRYAADPDSPTEACWCGDPKIDHTSDQGCTVQYDVDAPYDPAINQRVLRMMEIWESERDSDS